MSITIQYEIQLLAASLAAGACLMALYDILRMFRMIIRHGALWTGIEDLLYWLITSAATFLLLFKQNDGILRSYAISGVLLGMVFYNVSISRIQFKLLKKMEKYLTMFKIKRHGKDEEIEKAGR